MNKSSADCKKQKTKKELSLNLKKGIATYIMCNNVHSSVIKSFNIATHNTLKLIVNNPLDTSEVQLIIQFIYMTHHSQNNITAW